MKKLLILSANLFAILLLGCQQKSKYPYTVSDFETSLQHHLINIINSFSVDANPSYDFLNKHALEKDLRKLTLSEHPALRAAALEILMGKKDYSDYDLLFQHLDDTAFVIYDQGEFGVSHSRIADHLLFHFKFSSELEKAKTVDKVLKDNRYLESAYKITSVLEPQERYYDIIKTMARSDRMFELVEHPLYALSKFRKQEDVRIIDSVLSGNIWQLSGLSMLIMEQNGDSSYLKILEGYGRRYLYNRSHSVLGKPLEAYFETVASYKNARAAKILQNIWDRKPFVVKGDLYEDSIYLKYRFAEAVIKNDCTAFKPIIKKVHPFYLSYATASQGRLVEPLPWVADTVKPQIRW